MKDTLLVVLGPTASGKTALGVALALALNGEVVSADSALIYKGMDIGSAKSTPEEMRGVPHHMMDVVLPSQDYTVAMYRRQARACLQDIWQRGKLPIVVGGTGLYIQSLLYPMNFAQAKPNPDIREKWQRFLRENGPEALHEQLRRWDRPSAEKLHPNDTKRIIRYLEVFETTGKPFSAHRQNLKPCYRTLLIGLYFPRDILYRRIEQRVDDMMDKGLLEEVKGLLSKYPPEIKAFQALGYKQMIAHLRGDISLEEAVAQIKRDTRRFAKRQMTWFRRDKDIFWMNMQQGLTKIVSQTLQLSNDRLLAAPYNNI